MTRFRSPAWLLGAVLATSCSYARGDRWVHDTSADAGVTVTPCHVGDEQCGEGLERCVKGADGPEFQTKDDCKSQGLVCAPTLLACATCVPAESRCNGTDVERCAADGSGYTAYQTCDTSSGSACRDGSCVNLCEQAAEQRSNVGCEYWAADLDNADIDDTENAAAQQYAVVVSNPEPDLAADVTVEQDDSAVGTPNAPYGVARVTVPPMSLRVIRLGPREVDGSPRGTFNTGTGTAVSRSAFRVKSTVPIILVQFNPLDNVNVFSNDASLLKPVEALGGAGQLAPAYVVTGWPETIAVTDDPDTDFDPTNALDLRAFLTIVGTRSGTHVRVHTRAAIVPGNGIDATPEGGTLDVALEPFDVVNLETGGFQADFTGSIVEADQPVVVFSGSEASDAPAWNKLADRQCCADHLEEQLDPIRTTGKTFVATVSPNRTDAVIAAGATTLGHFDAPEFFRVVATTEAGATVTTTLAPPYDTIKLSGMGDFATITAKKDFPIRSDQPISVSSVSPSQGASGVPFSLPGGDPSFIVVPPIEQFRSTYVFLTPNEYSFDFVRIVAPTGTQVLLDGDRVDRLAGCQRTDVPTFDAKATAPDFQIYKCQLSFPIIDTSAGATSTVSPGTQNDGVHQIVASQRVGVLVNGFDTNVGYGYAAGTQLTEIVTR